MATTSWSLLSSKSADLTATGSPSPKYLLQILSSSPFSLISLMKALTWSRSSGWSLSTPKAYSSSVRLISITLAVFLADEFPDFPHAVNTERASTAERPTAINFFNFIIISFFLYCIECNITSYKINCN